MVLQFFLVFVIFFFHFARLGRKHRQEGLFGGGFSRESGCKDSEVAIQPPDTCNGGNVDKKKGHYTNREIFDIISKEHCGVISFYDLKKSFSQFYDVNVLVKYLYRNRKRYTLFKTSKKINFVAVYDRFASFCISYTNNQCSRSSCDEFHICKHFLNGFCRNGSSCSLSHSFSDNHNGPIKAKLGYGYYSDEDMSSVLRSCYPQVCEDSWHCAEEDICPYLHICRFFAKGKSCRARCRYSHDFDDDHNAMVINSFPKERVDISDEDLSRALIYRIKAKPHYGFSGQLVKSRTSLSTPDLTTQEAQPSKTSAAGDKLPKEDIKLLLCHKSLIHNSCTFPASCELQHNQACSTPYIWQMNIKENWRTMTKSDNENIEKEFCKLSSTATVTLGIRNYGRCLVSIAFSNMTATHDDQSYTIRRLSTMSFVSIPEGDPPGFSTQWRWYFIDDRETWKMYEKDAEQYTLEKKYLSQQTTYSFSRRGDQFRYKVDFQKMTQFNTETRKSRKLIRRPLFVSIKDVQQGNFAPSICLSYIPDPPPSTWVPWDLSETDFELVELNKTLPEFCDVANSFFQTMPTERFQIKSIERVQNRKLWNEYKTKKRNMEDAIHGNTVDVTEKHLFHGTDDEESCRGICTNSFDFRVSGKNATVYGEGSYFARDSKYSDSYTSQLCQGDRMMFRARVLVGNFTKGHKSYRRPPEIKGGCHRLYDSCVDDIKNPAIFVIFDRAQAYPEYLITYHLITRNSKGRSRKYRSCSNLLTFKESASCDCEF